MLFVPFSALDKILNFKQEVRDTSEAIPGSLAKTALLCGFGANLLSART
jgi:hypothetical protein